MEKDLVLGIDSSTTSCKAVVWDRSGNIISSGRSSLEIYNPAPGFHEQEAPSWWKAAVIAIHQACQTINPDRLAGLCISHQRETFVLVNESGEPIYPAILWMDERSSSLLPEIKIELKGFDFHSKTGKPLTGNLSFTKLCWLKKHQPQLLAKAYKILDVQSYLVQKLTGYYRTGWGSADPMGLYDMHSHCWETNLQKIAGLCSEQMPEVFPTGSIMGYVTESAASNTGLPQGLPVVAGIGDGQAAGIGANITSPGNAYLSLGTSVISGTYAPKYQTSNAFRTMYGGIPGSYLFETVLLGGTYTISWFFDHFLSKPAASTLEEYIPQVESRAAYIPPGSEGLVLVPYWNSAMNPYWDSSASGIVVGWNGHHSPYHFYRSILEGIALELRLQFQGVEQAIHQPIQKVIVMGGGAKSDLWCQIIANVTGKPIQRTSTPEAAALGAAIIAAGSVGVYPNILAASSGMCQFDRQIFSPDENQYEFYSDLFHGVYLHLFPSLQDSLQRLSLLARK